MSLSSPTFPVVRTALIGCGSMARGHLRALLAQPESTQVTVLCEPSPANYAAAAALFEEAGRRPPPNEPVLERLLSRYGDQLDTALIVTPHAYHAAQATACLECGLDVLLEKPMVISGAEADQLIATRDRTGRVLVVAFPGSLSPQIRSAVQLLRDGALGQILTISGLSWENWRTPNLGTWRQQPELAGGGFFFDTGAHMLNTITDLAGEEFAEVSAWFDARETPVEVLGAVMARLRSGVLVTMNACGDTCTRSTSDIRVFCTQGIIFTDIWGHFLQIQRPGQPHPEPIAVAPSLGVWQQFLAVRSGTLANPCPPEIGLRMARLWDAIRQSAAQEGRLVRLA